MLSRVSIDIIRTHTTTTSQRDAAEVYLATSHHYSIPYETVRDWDEDIPYVTVTVRDWDEDIPYVTVTVRDWDEDIPYVTVTVWDWDEDIP